MHLIQVTGWFPESNFQLIKPSDLILDKDRVGPWTLASFLEALIPISGSGS